MSEKRTERTVITTREKAQVRTRNPVKGSSNAGNKGDWDKTRSKKTSQPDGTSPNARRKEKETPESQ